MKTRSNMPLFVVECTDVKALSNSQIDLLRCGDYLVKKDSAGSHAYKVAYKKANEMSLVYCDAHNVEEVYYEKNSSGWHHVVTEITPIDEMPRTYHTGDVETLSSSLVEKLKAGDLILLNNELAYKVTYKSDSYCDIVYYDYDSVDVTMEVVCYQKTGNKWEVDTTNDTRLNNFTRLYKHCITDGSYELYLINTNPNAINFTGLSQQTFFSTYVGNGQSVRFFNSGNDDIKFDEEQSIFWYVGTAEGAIVRYDIDDWDLSISSDVVVPL